MMRHPSYRAQPTHQRVFRIGPYHGALRTLYGAPVWAMNQPNRSSSNRRRNRTMTIELRSSTPTTR
jgi:hypothetical protein